jgi:hypothetical protein
MRLTLEVVDELIEFILGAPPKGLNVEEHGDNLLDDLPP